MISVRVAGPALVAAGLVGVVIWGLEPLTLGLDERTGASATAALSYALVAGLGVWRWSTDWALMQRSANDR